MYKLENNVEWTEELKNAFKHGITKGKIKYYEDNTEVIIDYSNGLKNFKLYDVKNIKGQGFIGQATSRQVDLQLLNISNVKNLENKEFELFLGADYNGSTYYINYGKFIVNQPPENDKTNGIIKVTAFDYMIKTNINYVPGVTFPCTLQAVVEDICTQTGLILADGSFTNEEFIEDGNQFDGKPCREVLRNVAKSAFSWARIGQDNKLYLDFEVDSSIKPKLNMIKGDTFQQTSTGKNVFNKAKTPDRTASASATELPTGIKATSTASGSSHIVGYVIDNTSNLYNKTIRISTDVSVSGTQTTQFTIVVANTDLSQRTTKKSIAGAGHKETSYIVEDNDVNKVILLQFYSNSSSASSGVYTNFNNLIVTIDNEDMSYEPFTNQTVAPNPYYPQDIQVVTGDNNILVNNGNLGNMTKLYQEMYAFNPSYVRQETIDNKECIVFANSKYRPRDGFRGLQGRYKENTQYRLNLDLRIYNTTITSGYLVYTQIWYTDGTVSEVGKPADGSNWQSVELISSANKTIDYIGFSYGNGNDWCLANLSIIEDVEGQTYEYKEGQEQNYPISLDSIELCKIGNYQDYIYKSGDNWYEHKETGKKILDGTESWQSDSGNIYTNISDAKGTSSSRPLCNYFRYGSSSADYGTIRFGNTNKNLIFNKAYNNYTIPNWKAYLSELYSSNTPIICYYELATSTDTQITDTNLINQLNDIYNNLKLYDDYSEIIITSDNLKPTVVFKTPSTTLLVQDSLDINENDVIESITIDDYKKDCCKMANEYYGAINRVVYAESNIQGQEEKVEDADDIALNGLHELTIYDNYFAYTTAKRQELIQAGTKLFGLKYMPIQQLDMVGLAYLDSQDLINVTTLDNEKYKSIALNHIIEYNGAVSDSITAEANSDNETAYKNTNSPMNANSLTEIIVDRAMKEIKMIVDQYVNFLHNKTGNNNIFIDGTRDGQGFITKFVIKGSTTYFDENIITLVISEGIKNQETTLITEVEDTLFTEAGDSIIGETKTLYIDKTQIVLDDVLRSLVVDNITYYDELQILQDGTIQVIRRIGVAPNETLYLLDKEEITILDKKFVLTAKEEGLYYFIEEIDNLDYYAEYIIKNEYSDIYATEAYVNAGLDLKVNSENLVSELNASADIIKLVGQRLIILMQNYSLDEKGYMKALVGEIAGFLFSDKKFSKEFDTVYNFTAEDVNLLVSYLNGYATLNNSIENLYNLTGDSTLNVLDAIRMIEIIHNEVENTSNIKGSIAIKSDNTNELIEITNDLNINKTRFGIFTMYSYLMRADVIALADVQTSGNVEINGIILDKVKRKISVIDGSSETIILPTGITTPTLTQTSRADDKKDFEKLENALDEVMNTDIYKYHLKSQSEEDKKHVGFVIGSDFKYSHLITAENQERQEIGVDPYAMVSVLWKAVQEQQEQIEELKKEIKKLKGE